MNEYIIYSSRAYLLEWEITWKEDVTMVNGIVKWFDLRKGFSFIEQQDGPDVFVHHSGSKGTA